MDSFFLLDVDSLVGVVRGFENWVVLATSVAATPWSGVVGWGMRITPKVGGCRTHLVPVGGQGG